MRPLLILLALSLAAYADLVTHYGFDELPGSPDTLPDSFDTNHGTLISPANVTKGVTAPHGTGYTFGLRGGANIGSAAAVRPTDQFTMTWWMRPDTLDSFDRIYETLAGTGNSGNGIRIDLGGSPGDSLRVLLRDGNGSTNTQLTHSTNFQTNGTWYFCALRYDSTVGAGAAVKLTVLPAGSTATAASISSATQSPASLGTGPIDIHNTGTFLAADDASAASSNDFGGGLDDFAIFQTGDTFGVLTDANLATIYNGGALPFDPPAPYPGIDSFTSSVSEAPAGNSATLSWTVSETDTLTLNPGNIDVTGTSDIIVTPAGTTIYTLTATNPQGTTESQVQITVDGQLLPPVLNEFLANNNGSILDGDENASDWIEIHNPNLVPLDISGYYLTDQPTIPTKYPFAAGSIIPADTYVLIFASGQPTTGYVDPEGNPHTNFALRSDGEYLAFRTASFVLIDEYDPYPQQYGDISYSPTGYHTQPTPREENNDGFEGFVADTTFSHDRGYYTDPVAVTIATTTPGATIYYTTDGTDPSPTNGTSYTTPVNISTTTTLRAAGFRDNWSPTNVDTHTYLYLDDVLTQPNTHTGYPTTWAGRTADYEMDPDIVTDPAYSDDMVDSLKTFPTLSIVTDRDNFFGSQGIYQNPQSQGDNWERPVSAELIIPDASEPGFQIDAGIRVQGGSSRNPDTPKHSLSLRFRKQYGAGKLNYPLFEKAPLGETAVEAFDYLHLRSGYNYGWTHRHYYQADKAQYNREQWVNDIYLNMGQPGSHGRWIHLYLNGIYWGVYHIHERPDADFMASYFGPTKDDYDALSAGNAVNGDKNAWNTMISLANGSITNPSVYAQVQEYANLDSLIDYMLVNFYVGNRDWDGHNWRAARRRETGAGYYFLPWDSEFAISPDNAGVTNNPNPISNALTTDVTTKNGSGRPTGFHQRLALNDEYRLRFADRAHLHLHNGGPLSPTRAAALWTHRSDLMDWAILAESARWGDFRRDVDPANWSSTDFDLFTKNDHYLPIQNYILNTYIPQRSDVLLSQLRARTLYPAIDPPDFSQHGGNIPLNQAVTITNPNASGTIYYTTDGTDPRDPAAITYTTPPTINQSLTLNARVLDGSTWSALNTADFLAGTPASSTNLIVTEIQYNPSSANDLDEFIELLNLSAGPIELGDAHFTEGLTYTFPPNTTLAPGERLILARDVAIFEGTYGNTFNTAGPWEGALDNNGETLTLVDYTGETIFSVSYNDSGLWPRDPDGDSESLVLRQPTQSPDLNDPLAWRPSTNGSGNPGTTDTTPYPGGDLLSYALLQSLTPNPGDTLVYIVPPSADDSTVTLQSSPDLQTWTDILPTNREDRIFSVDIDYSHLKFFYRLKVTTP